MSTLIGNSNEENEEGNEPFHLLSFSIDIMSIILTQFLIFDDIGRLDTAYCNKKKRDQLLNILSNNESIVYDHLRFNTSYKSINKLLIWIGNRNIKMFELSKNEEGFLDNMHLNDNGLLGLIRNCNHLQSLNISNCKKITDRSMIEIGRSCMRLQSLSISRCWEITDTSMIEISRNCIHLKSLDISGCYITDTAMIEISRNCIHLKSLNISYCKNITDTGLIEISRNCIQLQSLSASWFNSTDSGISEISRNCIHLESLIIRGCREITDIGIIEISRNCIHLQSLDITDCYKITDISRQLFPRTIINSLSIN